MRCHPPKLAMVLLCGAAILAGCAPQQPLYLRSSNDLSHYIGMSQQIDNPELPEPPFSEVAGSIAPFSISHPAPKDPWNLKLEDAIRYALENAKVMRQIGGQVQGPPTFLTSNPNGAPTIYDPAIAETDARFGVNAGLSLFDPTVDHGPLLGAQSRAAEREPGDFTSIPAELNQDVAGFNTSLSKTTADGSTLSLSTSTSYDLERNNPTVQFLHDWQTTFADGNPPAVAAGLWRGIQPHRRSRRDPGL